MTRRVLPRTKWLLALALTGGILASFMGMRLIGNFIDFTDDHRVPLSGQQKQLQDQLEELRADDGLFVAAVGSAARPGLYESAYGLTALQFTTGRHVPIRVERDALRKDFSDEVRREPFSSLVWIAQIESATEETVHTRADADALLRYLTPEGFFRDPGSRSDSASVRLNNTAGALEALEHYGVELRESQRSAVGRWLPIADAEAPDAPVQLYHAVRIAALADAPVPRTLVAQARAWWLDEGSDRAAVHTEESVIETAYYVLLAHELNLDVSGQLKGLRGALDPMNPVSADPQVLSLIARAWTRLEAPPADLAQIADRIHSRQLPSGLVSSVRQRQGSLTSTYEVAKLRLIAALPSSDSRLGEALTALRANVMAEPDPMLRGAWLVLMDDTGAHVSPADRKAIATAVRTAAPRTVEAHNVDVWNRYTELLLSLDEPVPSVTLSDWEPDSAQFRYAQTLLINGLDRAGQLDRLPRRPSPTELVARAEERLAGGTVREAAEALHAAGVLGWNPTPEDAERITALLEKRRNCPGASAFYRDSAKDDECGVPGTRAAYRIHALLEGAVPAITRTP